MTNNKFDLEERLIDFAVIIAEIVEALPNARLGNYIAGQLVRSGYSPALNYGEAQSAESRNDFIHKMKIAAKEADETQYWVSLCEFANGYPGTGGISNKLTELQKIINAILGTAKRRTPLSYMLSFFIF